MPDTLDPQVKDTINTTNAKTLGEGTAFSTNNVHQRVGNAVGLAVENAVANQQAMNQVALTGMQMFTKRANEVDPAQAHALSKLGGSDNANVLAQLGSVVAALQQIVKTAQTTPPVTAGQ